MRSAGEGGEGRPRAPGGVGEEMEEIEVLRARETLRLQLLI